MGLDVGTAINGWAILRQETVQTLVPVAFGAITTSNKTPMTDRLNEIYTQTRSVIKKYKPEEVAIENLFYFKNQKTVIPVAQARGVLCLACNHEGLLVADYSPPQVKSAVTGYGRATKRQVQEMVSKIFKLKELPTPDDIADALAIAYCHASLRNSIGKL